MRKLSTTLNEMLNAGVHFGHQVSRWNPKMRPYIYGQKAGVHIIDLCQTFKMLTVAMHAMQEVVSQGGRVLFVGTKKQASEVVAKGAERCGQHFVNKRWLGGTLTNWATVQKSLWRMENLEKTLADPSACKGLTNKELILMRRDLNKLDLSFGGLRSMGGLPNMLFVLDAHKDALAVQEARICGIPVVGIVDTNADPTYVDYPIPGNDDAASAVDMYCREAVTAIMQGLIDESTRVQQEEVAAEAAKEEEEAQQTEAKPAAAKAKTESAEAKPAAAKAKTESAEAKPAAAKAKTESTEAKPAAVKAKTESAEAKPAAAKAKTESAEAKPAAVKAKTESAEAKPAAAKAKAESAEAKPAAAKAKTESTEAKPAAAKTKTESTEAKPAAAKVKTESTEAKPAATKAKAKPAATKAKAKPAAAKAKEEGADKPQTTKE